MRTLFHAGLIAAVLALPCAWAGDASPGVASPGVASPGVASPVGLWKNIDDVSGKPKALIRIVENRGLLEGRIEKLFRPAAMDQNPVCEKCDGVNKNQPIIGMTFMSGHKKDGNDYTGGQILDPDNGKVYKSKVTLTDGGKKLDVRGYVGMPMFGRSQVWVRQE